MVDPEDDAPKSRKWLVLFQVTRAKMFEPSENIMTAADAEEKARDQVLFHDPMPLDREEIDSITVRWMDEFDVDHVEKCYGNHCRHYDCDDNPDTAIDHNEYCSQCDVGAY